MSLKNFFQKHIKEGRPDINDFITNGKIDLIINTPIGADRQGDDSYLRKAHERGWLLSNDSVAMQASSNAAEDLQLKMVIEPVTDLKIDLNASWTRNKSRNIQFMYAGMPHTESGGFSMTTISIGNSFGGGSASLKLTDPENILESRRQP